MKRNCLLLFAAVFCGCAPQSPDIFDDPADQLKLMTFTGSQEEASGGSKTTLGTDFTIHWSTSDAITIFSQTGQAGDTFSVSSTENDGTVATFTGLTHESSNSYYYALYPSSGSARLVSTSGTVLASLPSSQTGVQDSFDPSAALSIARVDTETPDANNILHFKNAGALLSFLVPGNYVTRVKIESRDGSVAMTGPANINYNNGKPTVSPTSASKNYVEVTTGANKIGKRFYAVVYPGNYSQGFILTFYADQQYNRYYSTKALDLKRNAIIRLVEKNWAVSDDRPGNEKGTELIAPSISTGGQTSPTSASSN